MSVVLDALGACVQWCILELTHIAKHEREKKVMH